MSKIRRAASALALVVTAAAGTHGQSPAPAKPDYSQEAFVIEEARTGLRFEDDGTGRRESYMRIKTQSDAGVQAWGQLVLGYNAANERLDIKFVRVRKADGTTVTAPPESVQDLTSPVQREAPVYTDYRQKHVTVPGLRPGETLEVSTVTTIQTAAAPGHFWTEYDFQKNAVVLSEQVDIDVPAARRLTLKTAVGFDPTITESAGRRNYRWTGSNLVPTRERNEQAQKEAEAHPEDASKEPPRPAIRLTTFQDWAEVGRWYAGLEREPRVASPEVRRKALELTAGQSTEIGKIQALYDFVGPNFRYVSISLGAGRYQPRPSGDVFRDQYGDCKDKHTLLASMIESIGLQASTVLINSRLKTDPDFPSPSQFDHAITRATAGGESIWLDVTPEVAPFRLLLPNLRKKQALVIGGGRPAHLEDTPADPPMTNAVVQDVDGTLEALGRLNARVRIAARGDAELLLRIVFRNTPQANWKDVIERINEGGGIGGEISDWNVSDPAANHDPFTIEFRVSRPNYIDASKKRVEMSLPYASSNLPEFDDRKAADPIEIGSPQTFDYRVRLELGPSYQARVPVPVTVDRDYGKYSATYALNGRVFTATRSLDQRVGTLPSARAGDYKAFRRVVAADAEQRLALDIDTAHTTAADPGMKAADLLRSGYDALRSGNFEQALALLKRVVELEPAHKTAWTNLGQTYVGLRKYPDAVDAFKKQLDVNPYDEFANDNLAAAYVQLRRYPEAEATFRKQLETNPLDKWAHGALGRMYLEIKRYGDAVPELDKGISLNPQDASLHIDLGSAYLSLGKNDDAMAAFNKAAELSATPNTWNNVAYQLSLKGVHLDRAQQYAESAVGAVVASARNFSVDHFSAREVDAVRSLASYWDTLGWVYFAKGDLARAEPLVSASWRIAQGAEVGDHLSQIYEKLGRRDDAMKMYGLALNAERPDAEIRKRLERLAGAAAGADAIVAKYRGALEQARTFDVAPGQALSGEADFILLLGSSATAEAVGFASGDERLRPLADALRTVSFNPGLPADTPARVLRRATAKCASSKCTIVLHSTMTTRPVH